MMELVTAREQNLCPLHAETDHDLINSGVTDASPDSFSVPLTASILSLILQKFPRSYDCCIQSVLSASID